MKFKSLSFLKWALPVGVMALAAACSGGSQSNNESETEGIAEGEGFQSESLDMDKARNIFFMLPSPIETASLLKKAGADFNGEILHNHKDASKYLAMKDQAVNLGIYGADLSYSSIFEQSQECIHYISASRELARSIGVEKAFNDALIERMEGNVNNKDSLFNIISEAYLNVNSSLKESQRSAVAALVIAGGWMEGLYIGVQTMTANPNEDIRQRIAEQRYSLNDLIDLVDSFSDSDDVKPIKDDLLQLKDIFDSMEIVESESPNTVNDSTGVTTIGGERKIEMTDEQLKEITDLVTSMRNRYTAG